MMRPFAYLGLASIWNMAIAHPPSETHKIIQTPNGNLTSFQCGTDKFDASPELIISHQFLGAASPRKREESLIRRQSITVIINTYIHLVYSSGKRNSIPDQMWQSQFAAINQAFHVSGFVYRLIGLDKTVNDNWAAGNNNTIMQNTLRRGTYSTMNLYFMTDLGGGIIGQCSLPYYIGTNPSPATYATDGCLIHAATMPGGTFADYNQGKTAVHEIGHWMGLFHVFEGYACSGSGDYVGDTPLQSTATNGCPTRKDSCLSNIGFDSIQNYMDYSTDPCYNNFTPGQAQRMGGLWSMYRTGK
jgi:hypothetical protein